MLHYDVSYSFTSLSTFFLNRRSDVEAYSMDTNSLPKVSVKKLSDEEEMQNDSKKLNLHLFTKCRLQIENEKFKKKNTESFVQKYDDDRNVATLTLQNKIKQPTRKVKLFPVKFRKANRKKVYQPCRC